MQRTCETCGADYDSAVELRTCPHYAVYEAERVNDDLTPLSQHQWKTEDEIAFLNGLGSHRTKQTVDSWRGRTEPRRVLLERYLTAARRRAAWGEVDRDAVLQYAEWLLGVAA